MSDDHPQLAECLARAAAGETVIFVVAQRARPYLDMAQKICASDGLANWSVRAPGNRIGFANAGEVRFLVHEGRASDDYRLKGFKPGQVVLEHGVAEIEAQSFAHRTG